MKTLELKLRCELDEVELRDRAQQMAEALREAHRVSREKAAAMKDFKEQLEEINGRLAASAEAIRTGEEFRLGQVPRNLRLAGAWAQAHHTR